MKTGIRFKFSTAVDLKYAESVIDGVFPKEFAAGEFEVFLDGKSQGRAGVVDANVVNAFPKDTSLCIMADLDEDQQDMLKREVWEINKTDTVFNRSFGIVTQFEPS